MELQVEVNLHGMRAPYPVLFVTASEHAFVVGDHKPSVGPSVPMPET